MHSIVSTVSQKRRPPTCRNPCVCASCLESSEVSHVKMRLLVVLILSTLLLGEARADQTEELLTLRNTMVAMLEKLVADKVITEDEARAIVAKAEKEARDEAERRAADNRVAPDTVRVAYVPQ